jgi:uncharacterized protein YcbK (DUF882 family)
MIVVSGYRCERYNHKVGGVPNSYHTQGLAADIAVADSNERFRLVQAALACGIRRIGIYRTFVHLDIGNKPANVMWRT